MFTLFVRLSVTSKRGNATAYIVTNSPHVVALHSNSLPWAESTRRCNGAGVEAKLSLVVWTRLANGRAQSAVSHKGNPQLRRRKHQDSAQGEKLGGLAVAPSRVEQ